MQVSNKRGYYFFSRKKQAALEMIIQFECAVTFKIEHFNTLDNRLLLIYQGLRIAHRSNAQ